MKKIMTSIKTLAILLIAGAALTACTDDINIIDEQPVDPATQKYTMTVKASKDGDVATKALSLDGTTLNVTWTADEEVLVYQNESKIGTLTAAASSTASTTLSGALDSAPDAGQALTFYFHTAANPSYSGQDGTLTMIASTYDFCSPATVASGDFTVDAGNKKVNVPAGISFGANKQAIVKFTFLDKADGTTLLSPSKITASVDVGSSVNALVKDAIQSAAASAGVTLPYESNITIPATTYTKNGEGIIYLAIPDKLEGSLSGYKNMFDFTLTAKVGSDTYTLTKSGFPFENGKYYAITAKMTKLPPATGHALSESVVGDIVGSNGLAYAVEDKDNLPTDVTIVAMVAYKNGSHGLAIELNCNKTYTTELNYNKALEYASNRKDVYDFGSWGLPSNVDWQNMFLGCCVEGDATSALGPNPADDTLMGPINGFVEKMNATGSTSWYNGGDGYWSYPSAYAWMFFNKSDGYYACFYKSDSADYGGPAVLACLSF